MKINKRYFVGKNKPGVWASVYAYKPSDDSLFDKRGEIFASVLVEGPKEFDSSIAGNLILDILHETYFESEQDSILFALEEAVKAARNRLLSLVENDDSAAISGINFDLVTLVIKDNTFFSVKIGDANLKIYREGSLQDLSAGYKDPTGEGYFEVLSSILKPMDVFLISSPAVDENYSHDELLESMDDFDEISLKNRMLEDDSKVAFLMLGIDLRSKKHESFEEEVSSQTDVNLSTDTDDVVEEEVETQDPVAFSKRKFNFDNVKEKFSQKYDQARDWSAAKVQSVKNRKKDSSSDLITDVPKSPENVSQSRGANTLASFYAKNLKPILSGVYQKMHSFFDFVKKDLLAIDNDNVYLKGRGNKMNVRVVAVIGVILVIIIIVGIKFRQSAIEKNDIKEVNEQLIEDIEKDLSAIKSSSVFTINTPDNVTARQNVHANIVSLKKEIDETEIDKEYQDKIGGFRTELDQLEAKLLRIVTVSDPEVFADVGANFEGANPSDIAIVDGKMYISDSTRNVIYLLTSSGELSEFVSQELVSPVTITDDPSGDSIVMIDKSSTALALIDLGNKSINRFPGMSLAKFESTIAIDSYEVATGDTRLYLAMNTSPQVQQVNRRGDAYSDGPRSRWDDESLSGISDIELLDGKFVFTKPGTGVLRYYVDSQITTDVTGFLGGDTLSGATKITTDQVYLYVADPVVGRIVVLSKSRGDVVDYMDLIAQYRTNSSDVFKNVKDIVVDSNYIYVLDSAKVYRLNKADFGSFVY